MRLRAKTVLGLLLLALALVAFAPKAVGGADTFVVTTGSSMLPTIRPGAFVVTRAGDHYNVGDIVAYHEPTLHKTVLHRIIALDGSRFVIKGDNNNFIDPYHPPASDILGRLWIHVPNAGRALVYLHSPVIGGGVFALLLLLGLSAAPSMSRRQRRRRHHVH